jgi:hypothetical protein
MKYHSSSPTFPFLPTARDLRFSVDRGARASGLPPPVVCNHGRRLVWHWHQSSCYTFPSAARFTLSPISLALSLSETALSHLHHPACALRRAAYRCLSCQIPAAKLQQALRASARPLAARRPLRFSLLTAGTSLPRAVVVRGLRAFVAPQPSPRPAEPSLVWQRQCEQRSAVLCPPAAPCNRALALSLHSLLAATKGFSTRLLTCLVLSPSAPAFPHSSTRA